MLGILSNGLIPEAKASDCVEGPSPSLGTKNAGTKITNPLSSDACPDNQSYVNGVISSDNAIEFIFTTDSAPATDGGSDFPDDATTDHAFMVRSGIYDDGADQNDKNSAYYNKLSQEYQGVTYYSEIISYIDGDNPSYTVSRGISTTGKYIPEQFSPAGDVLNAYGTYDSYLQQWAPWTGTSGTPVPDVVGGGSGGVSYRKAGSAGSGGHAGALIFPAGKGGDGGNGPTVNYNTNNNPPASGASGFPATINASNRHGLVVSSVGGNGGNGGSVYLSPFSGADGGGGGKGGTVNITTGNNAKQIATSGTDHHGIFGLSRSGSGGAGGSGFVAFSGGSGGVTRDGGNVTINNSAGLVKTSGEYSYGIYGLSVSGSGGNGGDQWGIVGWSSDGAPSGSGGDITITNNIGSNIITEGKGSYGILAQSIGGSGGSSGDSSNLIYSSSASGQSGGDGGVVKIENRGVVKTGGSSAYALSAQSTGGGGGDSGNSWGLVAIGGTADAGGDGNNATIINSGTVETAGNDSIGIFAQSTGGSGGAGGNSGGLVALGGTGNVGGTSGEVTVKNTGSVYTKGNHSVAIFAESVGGGGGRGGSSVGMISVGGSGAGGGDGQKVEVDHLGSIVTEGDYAQGIYAQSVGGGGGAGGSSVAVGPFVSTAVGGKGSGGGDGGPVNINLGGVISTGNPTASGTEKGFKSHGVFGQSVGGGGGDGGGATSVALGAFGAVSVGIGGSGSGGGAGGNVILNDQSSTQQSTVITRGDRAFGVYLQSVGGGGGAGGYSVSVPVSAGPISGSVGVAIGGDGGGGGDGGNVEVGSGFNFDEKLDSVASAVGGYSGSITTEGDSSRGFFAQSVGGGGGAGGLTVSAAVTGSVAGSLSSTTSVGGSGGVAGDGGNVSVNYAGDITTRSGRSVALMAQSVGGGGGDGGGSIAGSLTASAGGSVGINVGSGGDGGNAGDGGLVTLITDSGTITTEGKVSAKVAGETDGQSPGVIAQSVGGGGGNGGFAVAAGIAGSGGASGQVSVSLGGGGSSGGDGNKVLAQVGSDVNTYGDSSNAVIIQSVGGGGGNGGFSVAGGVAGSAGASASINVGLGGKGAEGGTGGKVVASSLGDLSTKGSHSTGFVAQSAGGGGGTGGFNVSGGIAGGAGVAGSISVGLGGEGGSGNHGGDVVALSSGDITTGQAELVGKSSNTSNSHGIFAQSLGGGGGGGGFNVSAGIGGAVGLGASINVGIGGDGGAGGDGKSVDLETRTEANTATEITTYGNKSTGIVAQSVGGGGGSGGFDVSAGASGGGVGGVAMSISLGGKGTSGGSGGSVTTNLKSNVSTSGEKSTGVLVQSLGGGGGNGGFSVSAFGTGAGVGSGGLVLGIGGKGASGGTGGIVNSVYDGDITTGGKTSTGFIAQSIGGGGGNGGFNVSLAGSGAGTGSGSIKIGLGGEGGEGVDGGQVTAITSGSVTTSGEESKGVVAQSVGGGGGDGAFNVTVGGEGAGIGSGSINVGLGGNGGKAGDGKTVVLTVNSAVKTTGIKSQGVIAQSVGGGGGNGGFNVTAVGTGAGTGSGNLAVGLGGSGDGGGDAGFVSLMTTKNVETEGDSSAGITAQSVGKGGGDGAFNVTVAGAGAGVGSGSATVGIGGQGASAGHGGAVTLNVNNNVVTKGDDSRGVFSQSLGGGGGNGAFNVSVVGSGAGVGSGVANISLGGSAGTAGDGKSVTSNVIGDITTNGKNSAGVQAQSLGGGGGDGGFSVNISGTGAGAGSGGLMVGLGGNGGSGGQSAAVISNYSGTLETIGNNSTGFLAQSLGGGGGNGGFNVTIGGSGAGTGSGSLKFGLGGAGGTGIDGGLVNASTVGSVSTTGNESKGIVAQSVGGGGGNGSFNVTAGGEGAGVGAGSLNIGLGGEGGSAGDGKQVTLTVDSSVTTQGEKSTGIFAQSVGGGGGNGGFNFTGVISGAGTGSGNINVGLGGQGAGGGDGGNVTLSTKRSVITKGDNSVGIAAQSVGQGGGDGAFNVTVGGAGAGTGSGAATIGLGGSGGGAGSGKAVVLDVKNNVSTEGDFSRGVLAQSLGGGGGNGAFNVSVSGAGAGTGSGAANVSIGGSGGSSGDGDSVTSYVIGNIETEGQNAAGVTAQSLGGGGGTGGMSVSVSIAGAGKGSGAGSVGIGGSGGSGGDSGHVHSEVTGDVSTSGDQSRGVIAQSLGGGGGDGGMSITGTIAAAGTGSGGLSIGIGGSGTSGGSGNSVVSKTTGDISTAGNESDGLVVQSIGGGGGNGGLSITGTVGLAKEGSGTASIGVGGAGGDGGSAETVANTFEGNVVTLGKDSSGVFVQSLGGGGGDGAINITGGITAAKQGAGSLSIGIGGAGGDGGDSKLVTSTISSSSVNTSGRDSDGVLIQSIGGGGGNGGINVTGSVTGSKEGAGSLVVGVGGLGGGGSNSGAVMSTYGGTITTSGASSDAIKVQSIGGGGGNGGINISGSAAFTKNGGSASIGIGGAGGSGGAANNVTSSVITTGSANNNQIDFKTVGNESVAITAQSIGGGGGNGGLNISGGLTYVGENGGGLQFGLGGMGGVGGDSGEVKLIAKGDIETFEDGSHGIVAQSVGGGGGTGAINVSGGVGISRGESGTSGTATIGIGGMGGGAGNAQSVEVVYEGSILVAKKLKPSNLYTSNLHSSSHEDLVRITDSSPTPAPLPSQDVTDNDPVTNPDNVLDEDENSQDPLDEMETDVPDEETSTEAPASPNNPNTEEESKTPEELATEEENKARKLLNNGSGAYGIVAQSIGGSGGDGGLNISGGLQVATGKESSGAGLVVGVGGFGGVGGNADTVDLTVNGGGDIEAYGTGKSSVSALSLGGSGGNGGINITGGITSDTPILVGVGGDGAAAGFAKDVNIDINSNLIVEASGLVDSDGNVTNPKAFTSAGLLAQSIGGGGGNGGLNVTGGIAFGGALKKDANSFSLGVGGSGGDGNTSGNVIVNMSGTINSTGDFVQGLAAQSIGGGGGNGAINVTGGLSYGSGENSAIAIGVGGSGGTGSRSGNVEVTQLGSISTSGERSTGLSAQSIGGGGGFGGLNVTGMFSYGVSPLVAGVGGTGGDGSQAGSVRVTRGASNTADAGSIQTSGDFSSAIEASSIGGGGGNAGMNFVAAGAVGLEGTGKQVTIAVGGNGGTGSDGKQVEVTNKGKLTTSGKQSYGILAQSLGGGGGNANYNFGGSLTKGAENNITTNVNIGGQPGSAGNGDDVDVDHSGDISTDKVNSVGILGQSIGGGGGNVGFGMTLGFPLGNTSKGDFGLDFTLGRQGGSGGIGGDVNVSSNGAIATLGDNSMGIMAQSLGGGGGISSATTGGLSYSPDPKDVSQNVAGKVSVGIEGGIGATAGDVSVTASGSVVTQGEKSNAIVAQSVGGGGGQAGSAFTFGAKNIAPQLGVSVGGTGGAGGTGGNILLTSSATVQTKTDGSIGILAQSIGGGGGNGGNSVTGGTGTSKGSLSVSVGGGGGTGNKAGTVNLTSSNDVTTLGDRAYGMLGQSIGGGGGNAGTTINSITKTPIKFISGSTTETTTLSFVVGRDGGTGSTGDNVSVTNRGNVITSGDQSIGVFAQSIGGTGGNAGAVYNASKNVKKRASLDIAVGGSGGTGSTPGDVTAKNDGTNSSIKTSGDGAHGIYALSLGGGGGTGSNVFNFSSDISLSKENTSTEFEGKFTLGGSGGTGGQGENVTVTNNGLIATEGKEAHGIIAQSIGGGGGSGGMAIAGDVQLGLAKPDSDTDPSSMRLSIGGKGGTGNQGGEVIVTNTESGTIRVSGDNSYGVFAQSIGGGGGNGGFSVASELNPQKILSGATFKSVTDIAVGGSGGVGGDGGDVTVINNGKIISTADNSYGIFAQSLGGGGGQSSFSVSSPAFTAADYLFTSLMGGGQDGSHGSVDIQQDGDIEMLGANSLAFFAQEISGGGGNATNYLDVSQQAQSQGDASEITPANPAIASMDRLIGSGLGILQACKIPWNWVQDKISDYCDQSHFPGITSHITSEDNQTASTTQNSSNTSRASGVTTASAPLTSNTNGGFSTNGLNSSAYSLQSIGGSGGNSFDSIKTDNLATSRSAIILGSTGENLDSSKNSNSIDVQHSGQLSTNGWNSPGVKLQSIGSGGGNSTLIVDNSTFTASNDPTTDLPEIQVTTNIGSTNKSTGDGNNIVAKYLSDIETKGNLSPAYVIQSIGGGGGIVSTKGIEDQEIYLGGSDDVSGDSGNINFESTGSILTSGQYSHGMLIQAIGGGGGQFSSEEIERTVINEQSGNTGDGGDISVVHTGNIKTNGSRTYGAIVQSLAGGGGFVDGKYFDSSGGNGNAGNISFILDGDMQVDNLESHGIITQSRALQGQQGDISIEIKKDRLVDTNPTGHSIYVSGGKENLVLNQGTIQSRDNKSAVIPSYSQIQPIDPAPIPVTTFGYALKGEEGNELVENTPNSFIIGDVHLGSGTNKFDNQVNSTYITDGEIYIGPSKESLFLNSGFLRTTQMPVRDIKLDGSFTQDTTGIYQSNLDYKTNVIDHIHATGEGSVSGELLVRIHNRALVDPGQYRRNFFTADLGLINQQSAKGISASNLGPDSQPIALNVYPSAIVDYGINYGQRSVSLDYNINFKGHNANLNDNQTSIGDYLNRIQDAGSSAQLKFLIESVFDITNNTDLKKAYNLLSPEPYTTSINSIKFASNAFLQSMFSCGNKSQDTSDFIKEGHCIWIDTHQSQLSSSSNFQNFGFNTLTNYLGGGIQLEGSDGWMYGGSFGKNNYITHVTSSSTPKAAFNAESVGESWHSGLSLKKVYGSHKFGLGISYGESKFDFNRKNIFPTYMDAKGDQKIKFFSTLLSYSNKVDVGNKLFRILKLDLGYHNLQQYGFTEKGGGPSRLLIEGGLNEYYSVSPVFVLGGNFLMNTVQVKPSLSLGYSGYFGDDTVSARMVGAPSSVSRFDINGTNSAHYLLTGASIEFVTPSAFSFIASYSGQFGRTSTNNTYSIRAKFKF